MKERELKRYAQPERVYEDALWVTLRLDHGEA